MNYWSMQQHEWLSQKNQNKKNTSYIIPFIESSRTKLVALVVKNLPASSEDLRTVGSIPGQGRSRGEGHGNPLQYSCLENSMERGAWRATVPGIAKSQTLSHRIKDCLYLVKKFQMCVHMCTCKHTDTHAHRFRNKNIVFNRNF